LFLNQAGAYWANLCRWEKKKADARLPMFTNRGISRIYCFLGTNVEKWCRNGGGHLYRQADLLGIAGRQYSRTASVDQL